eukprot:Opistho-2@81305
MGKGAAILTPCGHSPQLSVGPAEACRRVVIARRHPRSGCIRCRNPDVLVEQGLVFVAGNRSLDVGDRRQSRTVGARKLSRSVPSQAAVRCREHRLSKYIPNVHAVGLNVAGCAPRGCTKQLRVRLAQARVGVVVADRHPRGGGVKDGNPRVFLEERLVVVERKGLAHLRHRRQPPSNRRRQGYGCLPAVRAIRSRKNHRRLCATLVGEDEAKPSAVGKRAAVLTPWGHSPQLSVRLAETRRGVVVARRHPRVRCINDGKPQIFVDNRSVAVLDERTHLPVCGETRPICRGESDGARVRHIAVCLDERDCRAESECNVRAVRMVLVILAPSGKPKQLRVGPPEAGGGFVIAHRHPPAVLVAHGNPHIVVEQRLPLVRRKLIAHLVLACELGTLRLGKCLCRRPRQRAVGRDEHRRAGDYRHSLAMRETIGALAPSGHTKELRVGLAQTSVRVVTADRDPRAGRIDHWNPDIGVEKWLLVVVLDCILDFLMRWEATAELLGIGRSPEPRVRAVGGEERHSRHFLGMQHETFRVGDTKE